MFGIQFKKRLIISFVLFVILSISISAATIVMSSDKVALLHYAGKQEFKAGNYEAASKLFQEAISINPIFKEAHYNLGVSYYELGKVEHAEFSFDNALLLDAEYAQAHYSLALLLWEQGEFEAATVHAQQSYALNPSNEMYTYDAAIIFVDFFRQQEAEGLVDNQDLALLSQAAALFNSVSPTAYPHAQSNRDIIENVLAEYVKTSE